MNNVLSLLLSRGYFDVRIRQTLVSFLLYFMNVELRNGISINWFGLVS